MIYAVWGVFMVASVSEVAAVNTHKVEIKVPITGTGVASPCKINNNTALTVEFSEINPADINGEAFAQTKTVSLDCPSAAEAVGARPKIFIDGVPATFNGENNVLQTTEFPNELGIALYIGEEPRGYPLPLKKWNDLQARDVEGDTFTFTAVPVKKDGEELPAGVFSSSATMAIEYQ
jgi:type 1 fimbria pilin